ncbi:unnamed protein product [Ilex paraguariensis]|uniref:K-box domain-containing protein n=1 Tax=Ilex paraguariensis TaxID=185542 RepID=A0ABC8S6T6_9AQUA
MSISVEFDEGLEVGLIVGAVVAVAWCSDRRWSRIGQWVDLSMRGTGYGLWMTQRSVKATIDRYKKACSNSSNTGSVSETNAQFYQQEASKLRAQIGNLQNSNRNMLGESLGSLSVRDLKNLESRLERGISKIRSKKVLNELLFAEVEFMQKREVDLHNNNQYLRAKIAENERAQQQMTLMPGNSDYELLPPQPFEARNYLQINGLQLNDHYSRQDHTSLQLV